MIRRAPIQMWPKIILFGDSHTQRSFDPNNGCWAAFLADKFQRVCDVVPRGFSGYNTRWCRMIMPKIFQQFDSNEIACVTILLGSNDSVPETSPSNQHVPVEEYQLNLSSMIDYLESIGIGKNKIILMTPPNFHQDIFNRFCMNWNNFEIPHDWQQNFVQYVDACRLVADKKQVSLVDLYKVFTKIENNQKLFSDGLHLSKEGGQLLYESLLPVIMEKVTDFTSKPLEQSLQYPNWRDVDKKDPKKSLC